MSRLPSKADKEPLMRMQRPSSASSQTTAHVLNSCFSDLLQDCQPVDAERIENLKVTKTGADQFHCDYVVSLQKAYDEYRTRLSELSRLEQHLVRARTEALVEEETRLARLKKEFPDYDKTGLPSGPTLFTKYLDEELLERHHLLRPSVYLPEVNRHYEAPKAPAEPNYQSTTQSFSKHARVSPRKGKVAPNTATTTTGSSRSSIGGSRGSSMQKDKPLWKGVLSAEEREEGKAALSELARRSQFMRNPRYKTSAFSNTAASGTARDGWTAEMNKQVESTFFVAEPSEVVFSEYEKDKVHEASVTLKNVSSASHQLRVLPPQTPFFSVSHGRFPTEDGLVAPGMSCSYTVRFTPDSLANFQDELKVLLHTGESFVVPLKGQRPAPDLTLPVYLDCGACLAGSFREVVMTCQNEGGEGGFVLYTGDTPAPFLDAKGCCTSNEGSLEVGTFTVSPTAFHLPPGATVAVKIAFRPDVVGECSEHFTMACDNCSNMDITLAGKAESLTVGVSSVENCSEGDRAKALSTDDTRDSALKEKADTTMALELSDDGLEDDCTLQSNLGHTTVSFDTSNPHQVAHKKVTIKNMSHTAVPFKWVLYVPLVRGTGGSEKDKEEVKGEDICNSLAESLNSPFAVLPDKGVLAPKEARTFIVTFCPQKVGQFIDMAHLVLEDLPCAAVDYTRFTLLGTGGALPSPLCSVSALSLELSAVCETYQVQLCPPRLNLLGRLQPGMVTQKTVQVVNQSVSNVEFEWAGMESVEGAHISIEPQIGSVVAGRQFTCTVAITPTARGTFGVPLQCLIKHTGHPLACPLRFTVQGPSLSIDVPSLNFGLVQVGRKSTLAIPFWNGTCVPVKFTVSLSTLPTGHSHLLSYLQLSHLSGELPSRGRTTLLATFEPSRPGHLRGLVVCAVEGGEERYVEVRGEAQRPVVSLDHCQLHLDQVYLNVPAKGVVTLKNQTLLATRFGWSKQYIGEGASGAQLSLSPSEGSLGPREEAAIKYEIVWSKQGKLPPLVATCLIEEMESPLHLSISGQVDGMAVHYELVKDSGEEQQLQEQRGTDPKECHPIRLDFGQSCPLGVEQQLKLKVINLSGIASSFHAHVVHFPAASPPAPPSKPRPSNAAKELLSSRKKTILSRTTNLADPRSKADKESVNDHHQLLLREGRGACFTVEPAQGDLPPFSSVTLTLRANSDMWGQYQDRLVIEVDGIENEESFPISYGVEGCPVKFVNTCSEGTSGLRYGSHPASAIPIKRTIKLHNTAPIDIRVDWETYCILPEDQDDKLLDFILRVGDPFPLQEETVSQCLSMQRSYKSNLIPKSTVGRGGSSTLKEQKKATGTGLEGDIGGSQNAAKNVPPSSSANALSEDETTSGDFKGEPLIRSFLVPHEGVKSSYPYSIEPQQVILPARGFATLTISFLPSVEAMKAYGKRQEAYALGFMTLDDSCTKSGSAVSRPSGDAVVPLRLDLMALIQHAQLSLTSDDDDEVEAMMLRTRADMLIGPGGGVLPSVQVESCYLLRNSNNGELDFSLSVSEPFSLALVDPATRSSGVSADNVLLKPRKSVQVKLLLKLTTTFIQELIERKRNNPANASGIPSEVGVMGEVTVRYYTGATQVWPVAAVVRLPQVSMSHQSIDFGCSFVGHAASKSFSLHNRGYSSALWTARLQTGHQFFVLNPMDGVLPPHLTLGRESKATMTVSCQPVNEETGRDIIGVYELLTGWQGTLPVSGCGSADEKVINH